MKYRGVYAGNTVIDVNVAMGELHPSNNKELRVSQFKIDISVLELTGSKEHLYGDIYPLHTNDYSVAIGYSVLMIQKIYRKVGYLEITRIDPNNNILIYISYFHHLNILIFGVTPAESCQFEIQKSYRGYFSINNNNKKYLDYSN